MKNTIAFIFTLLILSGCGATNSLTVQERATIQTMAISPSDITYEDKKETVFIMNKARMYSGMAGGAIGSLIYDSARDTTPEGLILQHFKDQNMLQNTISEAVIYQFQESGIFQNATPDKSISDAHLFIKMPIFQIIYGDDDVYKLVFRLDAQLKDKNGNIMWEDWEFLTGFNDEVPAHPFEKYISDPETLKQSISIVAQMIAKLFVVDMGGSPAPLNKELHASLSKSALPDS